VPQYVPRMLCPCLPLGAQDPNADDNPSRPSTYPPLSPHFGALPPFAPRPQPLSATPILANQSMRRAEVTGASGALSNPHEVDRMSNSTGMRRASRMRRSKERDEKVQARRQETISKAERALINFIRIQCHAQRQIRETSACPTLAS